MSLPPAADRILTARALNRAVLARQGLLQRTGAPLPRVLERMGGLQAQYAPSMYVGLWSRVDDLQRDALTRALQRRTVVQATLMRVTIHLVSRADYWPIALATREARRGLWLRLRRGAVDEAAMADAASALRDALAGGRHLRRTELEALLGKARAEGVGLWIDLVRVPPSGTWERRRADLFGLAEDWLGPPPAGTSADAGVELLVRRYLGAFGPAPRADIAGWAGLPLRSIAPVLERLDLRRFRDTAGDELLDLPRAPLPDPEIEVPVRYLPTYDATLLTHARRAGILPEEHRSKVFNTKMPQSRPTFLVDGAVAGTWRHQDGRITREPFVGLDAPTRRALDEEGDRLAAFHA